MKLSVSLTDDDLATLDKFVEEARLPSRSAGVQRAIRLLRSSQLEAEYEEAFAEWDASEDKQIWDSAAAAGLDHAAW